MFCSHMFAVINNLQVKTLKRFKAFERWTKRMQWENYATNDAQILPLDPLEEHKLAELETKPMKLLHDMDAARDFTGGDSRQT